MSKPINFQFICAGSSYTTRENGVPAPYLRRAFILDEDVSKLQKAEMIICGLGFYELWVNGEKITRGLLSPTISNPDDLIYYDTYNLLAHLRNGENVIGLCLGNGFLNNPHGDVWWDFDKAKFRSAPKAALLLDIFYEDGTNKVIDTSHGFVFCSSPIIFDDYRAGEIYDANKEIAGWKLPGFDASNWKAAVKADMPRGETRQNNNIPIKVIREHKPVSVKKAGDAYVYDFGINTTGLCRLNIEAKKDQKLIFYHGEDLNEDGTVNIFFINRFSKEDDTMQKDTYICKEGKQEWTPTFTYHGFRYVQVLGLELRQAVPETLTCLEFHTALEERGNFRCSDETANKLQEMTRRSTLSNFHHFPTDCPHREKNGWTADASLSSEHALLNLNPETNYSQWLDNIRLAMREDGALPGIIPTAGWGFDWGNGPAWDSVIIEIPYQVYRYRGDLKILKDNAHAILRYLEYLTTQMDNNDLLEIGLGDWCSVDFESRKYKSPVIFTDSVVAMDLCKKAAYIFKTLRKNQHAAFAEQLAEKLRSAIRERLIDLNTMEAAGSCQTSQAMAIFYNVFEPAERALAFQRLLEIIKSNRNVIDTGVLGGRVLFHVLAMFDYADLAYQMITRTEHPGYGHWAASGLTTLCECFIQDFHKIPSQNHHFWGDISHWFIRHIAGIHYNPSDAYSQAADKQGADKLDIIPHFIEKLNFASAYHIAPEGKIEVEWKRISNEIKLNITAPESLTGYIRLGKRYKFDDGTSIKKTASGEYVVK